jgi:hypothetical protein
VFLVATCAVLEEEVAVQFDIALDRAVSGAQTDTYTTIKVSLTTGEFSSSPDPKNFILDGGFVPWGGDAEEEDSARGPSRAILSTNRYKATRDPVKFNVAYLIPEGGNFEAGTKVVKILSSAFGNVRSKGAATAKDVACSWSDGPKTTVKIITVQHNGKATTPPVPTTEITVTLDTIIPGLSPGDLTLSANANGAQISLVTVLASPFDSPEDKVYVFSIDNRLNEMAEPANTPVYIVLKKEGYTFVPNAPGNDKISLIPPAVGDGPPPGDDPPAGDDPGDEE